MGKIKRGDDDSPKGQQQSAYDLRNEGAKDGTSSICTMGCCWTVIKIGK